MKSKIIFSVTSMIFLVSIISTVYYKTNYKAFDEAIRESNSPIDEIFHEAVYKGHTIVFYGKDDILSAGLVERNFLGYRWGHGVGSKHFNEENQTLTRSFSNLHPRNFKSDEDLVSLTFGVIYDDSIEKVRIKYEGQDFTEATIIETNKGRIWYCFSNTPFNHEPEVTILYEDGTVKTGWY